MLVRTTFVNSVGISTRSSNSSTHKLLYHVGPRWILPCSWGHLTAVVKVVTVVYCRIIHNHSIPNSIKTKNRQKKHRHHGRLCLVICVMCSSFLHSPNITFPQDYHTYRIRLSPSTADVSCDSCDFEAKHPGYPPGINHILLEHWNTPGTQWRVVVSGSQVFQVVWHEIRWRP